MDPVLGGIIGGAVSDAGGILGNVITNKGSKKRLQESQRFDLGMWHKQNAYNDPRAQMKRLQDAGLNPNLIYGQNAGGAAGNAGSVPASKVADYSMSNPVAHMAQYADYAVKGAQHDNLHAQSVSHAASAALKNVQRITEKVKIEGRKTANAREKVALERDEGTLQAEIDAANYRARALDQKAQQEEIRTSNLDAQQKAELTKTLNQAYQYYYAGDEAKAKAFIAQEKVRLAKLGIFDSSPWQVKAFAPLVQAGWFEVNPPSHNEIDGDGIWYDASEGGNPHDKYNPNTDK